MSHVRILLADDHEIVRQGVKSMIQRQPDWTVCGEAETGLQAVAEAERLRPDILIMDIGMPELNGLDATRQIKRRVPSVEILIFTANETEEVVRNVFRAGAKAYLLKTDAAKHLVPAIEALRQRRTYFSSKVSELVFAGYLKDETTGEPSELTPRERQVVQLAAEGKANKEMAEILGVSLKTIESHRAAVMRKLKLESIADLVRYAIRAGLIEP